MVKQQKEQQRIESNDANQEKKQDQVDKTEEEKAGKEKKKATGQNGIVIIEGNHQKQGKEPQEQEEVGKNGYL